MPPAAKKFEVLRGFHRLNDKGDGEDRYEPGDTYSGPVADEYLHAQGPDGQGPLIRERSDEDPKPADKPAPASDSKGPAV